MPCVCAHSTGDCMLARPTSGPEAEIRYDDGFERAGRVVFWAKPPCPSFKRKPTLVRCQVAPEGTVVSVWEGVLGGAVDLVLWTASSEWECRSRSSAYMRAEHGKLTRETWNYILCLRVSPDDCFHGNPWDEYCSA